jgi:hypothetical protein
MLLVSRLSLLRLLNIQAFWLNLTADAEIDIRLIVALRNMKTLLAVQR